MEVAIDVDGTQTGAIVIGLSLDLRV